MGLPINFQSIRSIVTSIIIVLGLLSLAAILLTGQIYHRLIVQSQLKNIERQLEQETTQTLQRIKQFSLQFSTIIVNDPAFRSSASGRRQEALGKYLTGLYRSPFLQNGVLNVNYIFVYDDEGALLVGLEYQGQTARIISRPVCVANTKNTGRTDYSLDAEVEYDICVDDNKPYLTANIPYNFNEHTGQLVVVSNISSNLAELDRSVTFPVSIGLPDKTTLYRSQNWPGETVSKSIGRYTLTNMAGSNLIHIEAIHKDKNLDEALHSASIIVISGAGLSTFIVIMLALYILRKTVIGPVDEVISSLRMMRANKNNLGAQVKSRGADEIIQLMDDFNAMSTTMQQFYLALEKMAYTDPLTRLGNRKLFHEKLHQVYSHAAQNNSSFALYIIDLNKFKPVNDTYGHQVGDSLLIELSNRLGDVIRGLPYLVQPGDREIASVIQDHLARLGGDEFAVIIPAIADEAEATGLAKQFNAITDQEIVCNGISIDVDLSIGIAIYPQHASTIEELIACADKAMYQAKKTGKAYMLYAGD